jgi:hypothetical protein
MNLHLSWQNAYNWCSGYNPTGVFCVEASKLLPNMISSQSKDLPNYLVIPHREIRELEDRSWSLFLVKEIELSYEDDDLSEIYETLEVLDDPRTIAPLVALMENNSLPGQVRLAASTALRRCTTAENSAKKRQWWASEDEILMAHAVATAGRSESDILEEIAVRPDHAFYPNAIARLASRFEERHFQQYKIQALSHRLSAVREIAADSLEFDLPVDAEEPLLKAIQDSDDNVARMAFLTLQYYSSQKVLLAIHDLLSSISAARVKACVKCFVYLKGAFLDELAGMDLFALPYFRKWLEPVREILGFDDDARPQSQLKRAATPRRFEQKHEPRYSLAELSESVNNPDGIWRDKKDLLDALSRQHFSETEREAACDLLTGHADHTVRNHACRTLAKWDRGDKLLLLLSDPVYAVCRSAAGCLREVSRSLPVAEKLFELLGEPETSSSFAQETLESYVVHADQSRLNDRLVSLALTDERESVQVCAINELCRREAADELQSILVLLKREPRVTWAVHTALIDACNRLGVNVSGLEPLKEIDDLYVQASLARLEGHRSA